MAIIGFWETFRFQFVSCFLEKKRFQLQCNDKLVSNLLNCVHLMFQNQPPQNMIHSAKRRRWRQQEPRWRPSSSIVWPAWWSWRCPRVSAGPPTTPPTTASGPSWTTPRATPAESTWPAGSTPSTLTWRRQTFPSSHLTWPRNWLSSAPMTSTGPPGWSQQASPHSRSSANSPCR